MEMEDELKIIKNCQAGRLSDFGLLYESYIKKIYGFIFYKVYNREIAQDLTSEAFLAALDKIKSFDPKKGKFSSWLYQIARNKVIDYYRMKKPRFLIDDAWNLKDDTDIQAGAEAKEKLEKVKAYLQKLSAEQREIIILRVWQDLPYKEIAEITGKSEGNCKVIFSRVVFALRAKMPMLLIFISLVLHNARE